jgi:hypothetical protein
MQGNFTVGVSLFYPVCNCKGYGNTDNEHKEWLDQIPEMQSVPFMVMELVADGLNNPVIDLNQVFV